MNRADAMLGVLRRGVGSWWTRDAIFHYARRFFLTNNAASELRARGYDVEHRVIKGQHHYRLQDSAGGDALPSSEVPLPRTVVNVDEPPQASSTPSAEQLSLVAA